MCVAAGLSNLCIFPSLQQFGFIFRERLTELGMTSSQITTIINTQPAISACTGLLNGPMFRRFSFRQVAIAGALFNFVGLFLTAFSNTFLSYMITYALCFGFGMGISVSASSLAVNTYFKNKRRKAAGFSWTLTGLGPIFLPYAVTFLLSSYGVQGTVIIFASISLHSLVCAMVYQPVMYHVRPTPKSQVNGELIPAPDSDYLCKYCEMNRLKNTGIFSSQYLYNEDDKEKPGYEIIDPGTPMLSRANDGWFGGSIGGSKVSLASIKPQLRFRTVSSCKDIEAGFRLNHVITEEEEHYRESTNPFLRPNNFSREREEIKLSASRNNLYIRADSLNYLRCTCAEEKALLELPRGMTTLALAVEKQREAEPPTPPPSEDPSSVTFMHKLVTFFDLDLLRDFTFVNLVAGLTIINFGELNFSILTPFILNDFGFTNAQTSLAMSVLAGVDITVRFLVPFVTEKINWDNRVFLLIGVVGMALGRTIVASSRSYSVILCCFVFIGMCKGLRTIFWPLIIPGYVPLKRLPGASGLQLLIAGVFTLACGPLVGLIRDQFNFSVTLYCLNSLTFIAAISWSTEALVRYLRRRKKLMQCVKT